MKNSTGVVSLGDTIHLSSDKFTRTIARVITTANTVLDRFRLI